MVEISWLGLSGSITKDSRFPVNESEFNGKSLTYHVHGIGHSESVPLIGFQMIWSWAFWPMGKSLASKNNRTNAADSLDGLVMAMSGNGYGVGAAVVVVVVAVVKMARIVRMIMIVVMISWEVWDVLGAMVTLSPFVMLLIDVVSIWYCGVGKLWGMVRGGDGKVVGKTSTFSPSKTK